MSDYKPTIGDVWPNEESMPDDVKNLFREMHDAGVTRLSEIDAHPTHPSKSWWQVDKTEHGEVTRVWANKPAGQAQGLWTFKRTIDDEGRQVFDVVHSRHLDEMSAHAVASWIVPSELPYWDLVYTFAELVGLRTAKGVAKRLGLAEAA